jgi:hypothetical protein
MTSNFVLAHNSLKKRLQQMHGANGSSGMSWHRIAKLDEFNGVSPATLWRIVNTDYVPKGRVRKCLGLPPLRVRIAADVTTEQRDALHALAAQHGRSWSEYCRELADDYIKENETK